MSPNQKRSNNNMRKGVDSAVARIPRQIREVPVIRQVLRFKAGQSYTLAYVTRACLYNLLVQYTTLGGSAVLAASARLRKVEMFSAAPPGATAVAGQFNNIMLSFTGAPGPNKTLESSGTAQMPAHIVAMPPPGSLTGFWGDVGAANSPLPSDVLWVWSGNAGDVVDVHYDYVPIQGLTGANPKFLTTSSGGTSGAVNINALDNTTTSGAAGPALFGSFLGAGLVSFGN